MIYPGEFHYFTREHVLLDAWHRVDDFFDLHLRASPPLLNPNRSDSHTFSVPAQELISARANSAFPRHIVHSRTGTPSRESIQIAPAACPTRPTSQHLPIQTQLVNPPRKRIRRIDHLLRPIRNAHRPRRSRRHRPRCPSGLLPNRRARLRRSNGTSIVICRKNFPSPSNT